MGNIRFVTPQLTSFGVDEEILRAAVADLRAEFWNLLTEHIDDLDIDFIGIFLICMSKKEMAENFSDRNEGRYKVTDAFTKEKSDWFTIPIVLEKSDVNQQPNDKVKLLILDKIVNYRFHKEYKGKRKGSYELYLSLLKKIAAELIVRNST